MHLVPWVCYTDYQYGKISISAADTLAGPIIGTSIVTWLVIKHLEIVNNRSNSSSTYVHRKYFEYSLQ